MNEIIRSIESAQLKNDIPAFAIGDTVRVQVKVVEGSRERLQAFEGVVIARRNGSVRETFIWIKRIVVAWIVLNSLGFVVAYLQPLVSGGQYTG